MWVSAIIPTWCEAETIEAAVTAAFRVADEVVVVDAGSHDETIARAEAAGAIVIEAEKGRGHQLAAGARVAGNGHEARSAVLLFIHADARLPGAARPAIEAALLDAGMVGGNFKIRFTPEDAWARFFSAADDWRRRLLSIYYGDSAVFVRREVYDALGGFRAMPIMEDYDLVRRLERAGRTAYIRHVEVEVSARRFASSPLRAMLVWALVQALYSSGVPASRLSRLYADIR